MRRVYLDNAATSFPKPPQVLEAMVRYATEVGAPARGAYAEARLAARLVDDARRAVATLVGAPLLPDGSARNVIFTLNTSDALNLAIRGAVGGAVGAGPIHLVTTHIDHNSVLRPFAALAERDARVEVTRVRIDPETGLIDLDALEQAIRPETLLVAINHASNVTGAVQDASAIGAIVRARCRGLYLIDAAQSLGHIPFDMRAMDADLVAFPGHKGLLGPTGTGGLVIRPGVERRLATVREGGTGWLSELEAMPEQLPERFEPGSHNTMGIVGLGAGVRWLLERGVDAVARHEAALTERLLGGLARVTGLRVLGDPSPRFTLGSRVGVVSFVHPLVSPAAFNHQLEERAGILARSGLHCAPLAHASLGTGVLGATRLSTGPFTTSEDIDLAIETVEAIVRDAIGAAQVSHAPGAVLA